MHEPRQFESLTELGQLMAHSSPTVFPKGSLLHPPTRPLLKVTFAWF